MRRDTLPLLMAGTSPAMTVGAADQRSGWHDAVRWVRLAVTLLVLAVGGRVMAEPATVVTLDVYSGRPNPEWTLSDAEARELHARLDALNSPLGAQPPRNDNLGYRGLRVTTRRQSKDVEVTVGKGAIAVEDSASAAYYRDTNRQLERWLFETGKPKLRPQLVQTVEQALAKPD